MIYLIETLLDKTESQHIINEAMTCDLWADGNLTNTYQDKNYKKNLQLLGNDLPKESDFIKEKILKNTNIINTCFPRLIHNLIFSRTGIGMHYKAHTDLPVNKSGRRDISFTLFLEDKNAFTGGELILYIPPETKRIKLEQGQAIFYPTDYIHEVRPVTTGERIACVGWIESEIPKRDDRDILGDLKSSIGHIKDQNAHLKAVNAYCRLYKKFSR